MNFLITTYPEPSHIMNSCAKDDIAKQWFRTREQEKSGK